ncbi:hypothetical protein BDV28DRAFT_165358 [Aspergillus coremiiformis]|uniref:Uncharacterized protein n=1 Tax=Aspergillus coremiiformis TaxID=138285 RepID=A0A5N6Z7N8_9EURO|nr:hypothetical protein BDV28DRAFT_165358 [Aspergillus coremiiformis]
MHSFLVVLVFTLSCALAIVFLFWNNGPGSTFTHQIQNKLCSESPSWDTSLSRTFRPISSLETISHPSGHSSNNGVDDISWESLLLPQNGGLLRVRTSNDTVTDHGVSMFHQLHCLIVIRDLIFPEPSRGNRNSTSPSHIGHPKSDAIHWAHCFDYIAQGIICAADDTIEPPHHVLNREGRKVRIIDGVGHTHACRDPTSLWRAVQNSELHPIDMSILKDSVRASSLNTRDCEMVDNCTIPEPYRAH